MPLERVHDQCATHTDGYTIGLDEHTATYSEPERKALVAADLFEPKRLRLLEDRVSGWFVDSGTRPMIEEEKRLVVDRIEAAFKFLGMTVTRQSG